MRCVCAMAAFQSGVDSNIQADLDLARKRQSEAEVKSARTVHDVCTSSFLPGCLANNVVQLNKEIGELESLIESKVSILVYLLIQIARRVLHRSTEKTSSNVKSSG